MVAKSHREQVFDKMVAVYNETNSKPQNILVESGLNHFNRLITDFGNKYKTAVMWDALFTLTNELEESYCCCLMGLYNAANDLLRTSLEVFFTFNYFDELMINDGIKKKTYLHPKHGFTINGDEWNEWKSGYTDYYPPDKNIQQVLKKNKFVSAYDSVNYLFENKKKLFKKLSKFSHGRPDRSYSSGVWGRSSIFNIKYENSSHLQYVENFENVYKLCSTLFFLRYPDFMLLDNFVLFKQIYKADADLIEKSISSTV